MAVTPNTKCRKKHIFSRKNLKKCFAIQKRISKTCGGLEAINPNLYKACESYAQNGDDISQEEFLCSVIGPDVLFGQYQLTRCGYNPTTDSFQGKMHQENKGKAFFMQQLPIILVGVIVVALIYNLLSLVTK